MKNPFSTEQEQNKNTENILPKNTEQNRTQKIVCSFIPAQEDTDFYNYLAKINLSSSWLDGTDQETEGIWLDSTGNNITYFNWRSDQPDNNNGNEHFLHYRPGWGGKWNDHLASHKEHIVCQKPSFGESHFYRVSDIRVEHLVLNLHT